MKIESLGKQKDMVEGKNPKILYIDLEVSPNVGWFYNAYNTNILKIEQHQKILSFAWQWEGNAKIECRTLFNYPRYKPGKYRIKDKSITYELHEVISDADLIIGHNSNAFDLKIANARFLAHNLPPIPEAMYVDTLKMARKYFKMPKNNLDEIYKYIFKKEGKTKVTHSDVLWDCLEGDEKAWDLMTAYNKRDVEITREVYLKMRGFDKNHPNLSFHTRNSRQCPKCLSDKIQRRGKQRPTRTGVRYRYYCNDCRTNFSGPILKDNIEKVETYG